MSLPLGNDHKGEAALAIFHLHKRPGDRRPGRILNHALQGTGSVLRLNISGDKLAPQWPGNKMTNFLLSLLGIALPSAHLGACR